MNKKRQAQTITNTEAKTETKSIFKEYGNPMIIRSVIGSVMYTADRLIAALFIGAKALVATTLISPLMFLSAALSSLLISGAGAYIGLLIGREKAEKASRISSTVVLLMLLLGALMAVPSAVFAGPIAHFLGARGDFHVMAQEYLRVFAWSFPFMLAGRGLDVLILNDGSPTYSFRLNMITTGANLGLNLIAVAVLGWGITGLAAATVVSGAIQFFGGVYYFLAKAKVLHFTRPSFDWRAILRICYNGSSDFVMMLVESVMVFVINMAFVRFLTPAHFEAYASVSILIMLFYSIFMGAAVGLQPMHSQMMGRGQFEKLVDLLRYSVRRATLYGAIAYLLFIPFSKYVLMLFIKDPVALEIGQFFYLTMGLGALFSNYPLQATVFFTSINRPMESVVISVLRTLVLIPGLAYLLIMQMGAWGVSLGLVATDALLIIGLLAYLRRVNLATLKVVE